MLLLWVCMVGLEGTSRGVGEDGEKVLPSLEYEVMPALEVSEIVRPCPGVRGWLINSPIEPWLAGFLLRRTMQKATTAAITRTATPPNTPPTMAPIGVDFFELLSSAVFGGL
jgi:hypothetical protein